MYIYMCVVLEIQMSEVTYPTKRKVSLEFKSCYFANGKFANINSAYYYILRNLSMIAYNLNSKIKIR